LLSLKYCRYSQHPNAHTTRVGTRGRRALPAGASPSSCYAGLRDGF
jgi:hypothetical protein